MCTLILDNLVILENLQKGPEIRIFVSAPEIFQILFINLINSYLSIGLSVWDK